MTDYPITRESHAAHTGPGTGWDLEWITVEAPTRDGIVVPEGFTYHSGNRERDGKQYWFYTRKAPFSLGTCPRCIPVGVIGGAVSGAAIGAAVAGSLAAAIAGAIIGAHATAIAEPPATILGEKPTE